MVALSDRTGYGAPIGIMLIDDMAPFIPGSVGNASTWNAPVRYRHLTGLITEELLTLTPSQDHTETVILAARALEAEGAQVITANCGFMLRYQRAVQDAVRVPAPLSSLLLVPILQAMLPQHNSLGVVTASSKTMTPEFLTDAGLHHDGERLVIAGLDDAAAFNDAFVSCTGTADIPAIRAEVVSASEKLVAENPSIGALLLECSELPAYAAAVQRATGLPVFDFTSLVEFFVNGLHRKGFKGFI
ncbi:hypothetical protein OK17_08365 [Gordonia sp. GN26]